MSLRFLGSLDKSLYNQLVYQKTILG